MLHLIQNDPKVPAGMLGDILRERDIAFRTVRLYAGDELPAPRATAAVIVLGGFMGVHDAARYPFLARLKDFLSGVAKHGTPILGICLGGQLLASALGAEVREKSRGERGMIGVNLTAVGIADPLFEAVPESFTVFQWHSDSFDIPTGAAHLATSVDCFGQAFRFGPGAYGLQFHPEVDAAIVADWCRRTGAGDEIIEIFRQKENESLKVARRLLENFLGLMWK